MAKRRALDSAWTEFEGADFNDTRRSQRLLDIVQMLAREPSASLPEALGYGAELEGAYRFLRSDAVTPDEILEPHFDKTLERISKEKVILAVHDSSEFRFGGAKRRSDLGVLNRSGQGFLGHFSLAVSADLERRPLGLLAVNTLNKEHPIGARSTKARARDENRQSKRWLSQALEVEQRVGDLVDVIHVEDREGDIYTNLSGLLEENHRFVIRLAQNRLLENDKRLFDELRSLPSLTTREVALPMRGKRSSSTQNKRHPPRGKRTALLGISATHVRVLRTHHASKRAPEFIEVNAVRVFEVRPPQGETPVEWFLATTEPIQSPKQLAFIVDAYRSRWTVEEYFKALKTGCAYESRQLESLQSLLNALAIFSVLAWRLLFLKQIARTKKALCLDEITTAQLAILRAKKLLSSRDSTPPAFLAAVARLGGHLKNNGSPGWLVLWRGYRRLLALEEGWNLSRALQRCDQS